MDRIQQAIEEAEALLVVLSPASVNSEWCRRELNAGLIRELEEARVLVLPVFAEQCEIPMFLRDKYRADFTQGFDQGLEAVVNAIAGIISTTLGRMGGEEDHIDYAIDWGSFDEHFFLRLTIVQAARANPFSVLSEITVLANDVLTRRYNQYEEAGLDWVGRGVILELLRSSDAFQNFRVRIMDDIPAVREMRAIDPRTGIGSDITVRCRRLGADTGMDILVPIGVLVTGIIGEIQGRMRPITEEEQQRLARILGERPQ